LVVGELAVGFVLGHHANDHHYNDDHVRAGDRAADPNRHRDALADDDITDHNDNRTDYHNDDHHDHHDDDHHDIATSPAGVIATARTAFAHDAVLVLGPDGDPDAPGGAITVALCGHWDHPPPCPLAPHHTHATRGEDNTVRLRVLFAVAPEREGEVRSLIGRALASGRQAGPDGHATTWTVRSSSAGRVRPDEADHAARLAAGA
jgi:hypothetical protein